MSFMPLAFVKKGTGFECKKCGSKFRVIWGLKPDEVSTILEKDCGYRVGDGDTPSPDKANIFCSKCGGKEFGPIPLEEKIKLQREWIAKWAKKSEEKMWSSAIMTKVPVSQNCPLCDRKNDISNTKYGLPLCNQHYVSDVRKFLIQKLYLKLKGMNNATIKANPVASACMINHLLRRIFDLLSWEPETIPETQYLKFSETSSFAGYMLLRVFETLPNLGEMLYAISSREIEKPESLEFETAFKKIYVELGAEYEFFMGMKLVISGYFDIAVDDEADPKKVLIVPVNTEDIMKQILLLRLEDANALWHGTFRKILTPHGIVTLSDESGVSFLFNRNLVRKNFELFKDAWKHSFKESTTMTAEDFESVWDWLKWVTCTDGFTENDQSNATYFTSYKEFGIEKTLVFELFNQVLVDPSTRQDLISTKNLSQRDPYLSILHELGRIARGFKIRSPNGWVYFVPCREWFYNAIMPALMKFARSLQLPGYSFEDYIAIISSFYSKAKIEGKQPSPFGSMIDLDEEKGKKQDWRVLEKKLPIEIPDDEITKKIGNSGEVDLLAYANRNLYLIELKALNLESKDAVKYLKEKMPIQVAKYAHWIRKSNQFKTILQNHGIKEQEIENVRVFGCCSGGSEELIVKCQDTGELFSIVPEFVLFSVMADIFTLTLDDPSLTRLESMGLGFRLVLGENLRILWLDFQKDLQQKLSSLFTKWKRLITLDRRRVWP